MIFTPFRIKTLFIAVLGALSIETLGHSQGGLLTHKLGTNSLSSIHLNPAYKGESQRQNHNITIPAKTSNPLTEHSIEI